MGSELHCLAPGSGTPASPEVSRRTTLRSAPVSGALASRRPRIADPPVSICNFRVHSLIGHERFGIAKQDSRAAHVMTPLSPSSMSCKVSGLVRLQRALLTHSRSLLSGGSFGLAECFQSLRVC